MVCGFADVFPKELPVLPLVREMDFKIEIIIGAPPIYVAPYKMAQIELTELRTQLDDFLRE